MHEPLQQQAAQYQQCRSQEIPWLQWCTDISLLEQANWWEWFGRGLGRIEVGTRPVGEQEEAGISSLVVHTENLFPFPGPITLPHVSDFCQQKCWCRSKETYWKPGSLPLPGCLPYPIVCSAHFKELLNLLPQYVIITCIILCNIHMSAI